tara:strand:- start:1249 stop:1908 length:660 start_codon:yes stop_codon:yes gene_type:complete
MTKQELQALLSGAGLEGDVLKGLVEDISAPAAIDKVANALGAMRKSIEAEHKDEMTKALGAKDIAIEAISKGLTEQLDQNGQLVAAVLALGEGVSEKLGNVEKALADAGALGAKLDALETLVKAIGSQPVTTPAVSAANVVASPGETEAAASTEGALAGAVDTVQKSLELGKEVERNLRDQLSKNPGRGRAAELIKGLNDLSSNVNPAAVVKSLGLDIK